MGWRAGFASGLLAVAAMGLGAGPAAAQFSDGYNFIKAVKDADGDKVMSYLNKPGAPALNARDSATGETALHIVLKRHDMTYLGFLLGRGAQTEIRDNDGATPLLLAARLSDAEAVRTLLTYGAKVNATNSSGETPLIVAVHNRDLPTIRLLVTNGADPKIADTIAGKNARDYAAEDPRGTAITRILDEAKPQPKKLIGPVR